MGDTPQVTVNEVIVASTSLAADLTKERRKQEMASQEKAFESKYGMAKPKSSDLLRRRLSKGGKGQYFDSGDYNMGGRLGGAQRSESQLTSAPAVTPGAGGHAASLMGRRQSQPSKLGVGQVLPTSAEKPVTTSNLQG